MPWFTFDVIVETIPGVGVGKEVIIRLAQLNCNNNYQLQMSLAKENLSHLPEDGMVEMSSTIELESSMQTNNCRDIILGHSISQFPLSNVKIVNISSMVLAVVELHDLS